MHIGAADRSTARGIAAGEVDYWWIMRAADQSRARGIAAGEVDRGWIVRGADRRRARGIAAGEVDSRRGGERQRKGIAATQGG